MKKFLNVFLLFTILSFLTGCAGVIELFKEIPDKGLGKTPEKEPQSAEAFLISSCLEKATEYEKNDELQMALFHLKIADTLNPNNKEITSLIAGLKSTIYHKSGQHFRKGEAFYKKNKFKESRKQFLIALRYDPDHKEALDYLKNRLTPKEHINYKVKKKDTLRSISKKFYKDPGKDFLIAYFNNLKTNTQPAPGSMLELPILESKFTRPIIDTTKELKRAENFLKEKLYGRVLAITGKILAFDRLNKRAADLKNAAYYQMGLWLYQQEQYPEALNMFKKVDPEYEGVREAIQEVINNELKKAKSYLKERRYKEVLAITENILDYDESNQAAQNLINATYCIKGRDLIIQKNFAEALKVLNKADPGYDCVEKAISDAKEAIKKQAEVHYLRGVKYFLNEELDSAIMEWEKALSLDPEIKKAKDNIENARSLLEKLKKVK